MQSEIRSDICRLSSAISNFLPAVSAFLALGLALSACHRASNQEPNARAADEWIRSYPLDQGGRVSINNRNGGVEIEGVEGSTVEVLAERVTHATTAKTAQELLSKIAIAEEIKPDVVSIRTQGIEGILLGVSFEVSYRVKVPRWATVRVQVGAGNITVTGINGRLVANATSGVIKGENLAGGVETRVVNGETDIDLAGLGTDPVSLRSTNGSIRLRLPPTSNANLAASSVNGAVSVTDLTFEPTGEQGPERGRGRRLRGVLNKGGTAIEVQTVNGSIAILARGKPAQPQN